MKQTIRPLIALIIVLCLFIGVRLHKTFSQKGHHELVVGMIIGYPPYAMVKTDGSFEGFDVEVAQHIAQTLKKQLVIKDMDLSALIIALQQNKIDMVLTGLSITQPREEIITMIHYAGKPVTRYPLAFWQHIPTNIQTVPDVIAKDPTAIISVEPGSVQERFLLSQISEKNILHVESMQDVVMNLKYGKTTAALLDPDVVSVLRKQSPELVILPIELPSMYQSKGVGIGINKTNTKLANEVRTIVAQLQKDGTLDQLHTTWFGQ